MTVALIGLALGGAMMGYAIRGMLVLRRIRQLANGAKSNPNVHDAIVTLQTLNALMERGW